LGKELADFGVLLDVWGLYFVWFMKWDSSILQYRDWVGLDWRICKRCMNSKGCHQKMPVVTLTQQTAFMKTDDATNKKALHCPSFHELCANSRLLRRRLPITGNRQGILSSSEQSGHGRFGMWKLLPAKFRRLLAREAGAGSHSPHIDAAAEKEAAD
jgi:hypothetical protein